ncbi:unnamed protein product [Nyctereutes procyonoides]|uniref:(raccoon dog) hypothetical protein n=1 Tax=Nyctereutes procyonoides TaxID=34880 RepID=A0A811YL24_NYCPR|nr:unnamed protein product [Nyctereutes procyonoides]
MVAHWERLPGPKIKAQEADGQSAHQRLGKLPSEGTARPGDGTPGTARTGHPGDTCHRPPPAGPGLAPPAHVPSGDRSAVGAPAAAARTPGTRGVPGLRGQAATPTSAPGHGCKGSPNAVPAVRALTFADGPLRPGCKCCRPADSLRTRSGGRGGRWRAGAPRGPSELFSRRPSPHTPPAPWGPPGEDSAEPARPAHDGPVCPTRRPRSLSAGPASGTHDSRTPRQSSAGRSDQGSPAGDTPPPRVHTARGTVLTANTGPARPGEVGQPVSRSPPATAGTGKSPTARAPSGAAQGPGYRAHVWL